MMKHMKHIGFISMMVCVVLMLASCSDELEDVFNGNNKDVIAPVELDGEDGVAWTNMESHGQLLELVPAALVELGIKLPDDESLLPELFKKEDYAVVVNNGQPLKGVVGLDGEELSWPGIDFKKYSLVLGWVIVPSTDIIIGKQRIKNEGEKATLYVELIRNNQADGGFAAMTVRYFAALYPKLNQIIVDISRWKNYIGDDRPH